MQNFAAIGGTISEFISVTLKYLVGCRSFWLLIDRLSKILMLIIGLLSLFCAFITVFIVHIQNMLPYRTTEPKLVFPSSEMILLMLQHFYFLFKRLYVNLILLCISILP